MIPHRRFRTANGSIRGASPATTRFRNSSFTADLLKVILPLDRNDHPIDERSFAARTRSSRERSFSIETGSRRRLSSLPPDIFRLLRTLSCRQKTPETHLDLICLSQLEKNGRKRKKEKKIHGDRLVRNSRFSTM